jgi:hypothetical protein
MTTPEDREIWERDEEALRDEVRQLSATLDRAGRDAITEARAYVALHEKARADAAKLARVEALHHPVAIEAITGQECIAEECSHEDECPTSPVEVCSACWEFANEVDAYYGEGGITPVVWPCETIRAVLADAPAELRRQAEDAAITASLERSDAHFRAAEGDGRG